LLDVSHNPLLVIASLAVALMAGFTGLSLTRGASRLQPAQRKRVVAMSAVALGGGIWSMHFVAMLGLQLPVAFFYDALITLISALLAILVTGIALLLLHFGPRTAFRVSLAGAIVGVGIVAMHYTGMSGIEMCTPVYTVHGIVLALIASILLCIGAFRLAYDDTRGPRSILLGTFGFGMSVFVVHFAAMAGTGFVEVAGTALPARPVISNEVLAFGVTLAAFVISGGFLLTGATFGETPAPAPAPITAPLPPTAAPAHPGPDAARGQSSAPPDPKPTQPLSPTEPQEAAEPPAPQDPPVARVPYEKDGRTRFLAPSDIAAIRAEGHYTIVYSGSERLFCPWSIAQAEDRLASSGTFLRTHRSYLVNGAHVSAFERKKDTGVLYFETVEALDKVPVARARLTDVRARLGL